MCDCMKKVYQITFFFFQNNSSLVEGMSAILFPLSLKSDLKNMSEQWKPVATFGTGIIFAKDNERKIVTPGMTDFHYVLDIAQLVRAATPQQEGQQFSSPSPKIVK